MINIKKAYGEGVGDSKKTDYVLEIVMMSDKIPAGFQGGFLGFGEMIEKFGKTGPYFYWRKHAGSLEREVISADERLCVFREFSAGKDTAIMTNYVQDLIEYIDRNF